MNDQYMILSINESGIPKILLVDFEDKCKAMLFDIFECCFETKKQENSNDKRAYKIVYRKYDELGREYFEKQTIWLMPFREEQ